MDSYTLTEILALKPCKAEEVKRLFKGRSSMTARQAFSVGFTVSDLCWVAGSQGKKIELVKFAILCAESVKHLNRDVRVDAAIKAATNWVANPTQSNAYAAYTAAYAANAADYGDYGAYAADYGAYAAANAAYAADYGAYAASNAASNAAYAVARAANIDTKGLFLKVFEGDIS